MLYLKPKSGSRSDGSTHPEPYILIEERADAWVARPFMNPACPALVYPKYAWEAVTV